MTNQERRKLQSLIRRHVAAQLELSWANAANPFTDVKAIEELAKVAKRNMNAYLSLLVNK